MHNPVLDARLALHPQWINPAQWSKPIFPPITVPGGERLYTLRDCADYISDLPLGERGRWHWIAAMSALIQAADGGGIVAARTAVVRALNSN